MAVRFEQVSRHYGEVVALDGLDLDVGDTELLVLVGPSGSGKSTALRLVAGLEAPTAGRVLVDGQDVTGVPARTRNVGMVFQDYALFPHLTVADNIGFGLAVRGVAKHEASQRVAHAADTLGLGDAVGRYPDELSGGQQQRVALARAMVREPAVYLLDEPLAALDTQLRLAARADVVDLQRRLATTTVYVTHDQTEAMTMGDRVAVLSAGRLEQVGPPQDVYDRPASTFVASFLGSPPMNLVAGGGVLGGADGQIVGARPEDLVLDPTGTLAVRIALVEPLGSETLLSTVAADDTRLWVRTGPRSGGRAGDAVRLRADPAHHHLFDAASGLRIEAFLVVLATRRQIPAHLYEAAEVEGAGPWQQLRRVTLPLLAPVLLLTARDIVLTLQVNFVPGYLLTDGGPANATLYLPLYVFDQAFEFLGFGYGAMITTVIMILTAACIVACLLLARRWRVLR